MTGFYPRLLPCIIGLCVDLSQNEFKPTAAMKVSTYIQDYTRPGVDGFDLDMNAGVLTIYFDEPVRPDNANVTGIILQYANFTGHESTWSQTLTRSSLLRTSRIDSAIIIDISKDDLDEIKVSFCTAYYVGYT